MIDVNALRGRIAEKGVFGSDEIECMIDELDIKDPAKIFFAKKVT